MVRRDNIGDLVCTTPLLAALRRAWPQAWIGALVNSYNAAVLDRNPDLDEVLVYTKLKHLEAGRSVLGALAGRIGDLWRLRRRRLDCVVLANPLEAYDAVSNPYITLDYMSVDLSIYNGKQFGADRQFNMAAVPNPQMFASRQRTGAGNSNIWNRQDERAQDPNNANNDKTLFDNGKFLHTLGYINGYYNNAQIQNQWFFAPNGEAPLTFNQTQTQRDAIRGGLALAIAHAMARIVDAAG